MKKIFYVILIASLLFITVRSNTVRDENKNSEYVLYDLKDLDNAYINSMQIEKCDKYVSLTYVSSGADDSDKIKHVICLYGEKSEIDRLYSTAIRKQINGILDIEALHPHVVMQLMIVYREKNSILSSMILIKDSYGNYVLNDDEKVLEQSVTLNNTGVNYIQKSFRKMPTNEIKWRCKVPENWTYDQLSVSYPMTAIYEIRTDKDRYTVLMNIGGD
ncbi:MAG: hypothetical protein IKH73_03780 [Erysipelotrichaceae bacterium]|nr:hypothetical protein [Erysipelotrichaceae bacterium]